jgi:hypothetical protein
MSNTRIHKGKGYFNNGIENKPEVKKYLFHCRRHNREKSYFKQIEIRIKESIADKEMVNELESITQN